MGKKLYEETQSGGIRFKSGRKPWEVRTPCYVYDLWLPVIGATALGVYGLYCRLERQGTVKAITLRDIADACRIGKDSLYKVNDKLVFCEFVTIVVPERWQRLAHFTTEITVLDPPEMVSIEIIEKLLPQGREYKPLTPWLVEDSLDPTGSSERPTQVSDEDLPGSSNVVTLGLKPLDVVLPADAGISSSLSRYTPGPGQIVSCVDPDTGEEVGNEDWYKPVTQVQAQACCATGRASLRTPEERAKLERIQAKLETGEIPEAFWRERLASAEKHNWSLPQLIKWTLNIDKLREWRQRQ